MNFEAIQSAYPTLFAWIAQHGARVLLILFVAVVLDLFLRGLVYKKSFGIPGLGSRIKKHYEEKIGEEQQKRVTTIVSVVGGVLSFSVFVVALLMVLPEFGVNIAPILAGVGLAGLAVGMAAKDVLTDFIAGLFILIEDQFNIGDRVKIADLEGIVKEITLRRTVIEGGDGVLHLIPNREIKVVTRIKKI
jgi:small conductance mechanosensitive channel